MKDLKKFLREFNNAWAEQDNDTILAGVTEDVRFSMANSKEAIEGKAAFADWLSSMDCGHDKPTITTERLIIDGDNAALSGSIIFSGKDAGTRYAFCDVYTLREGRISEIVAYCVKLGEGVGMEAAA